MQKKLKFSTLALSLVQSDTAIQRNKKTNRQLCVASGSHVNDSGMTSNRFSAAVADGHVEESRVHLLRIWVVMSNKDEKTLLSTPRSPPPSQSRAKGASRHSSVRCVRG